MTTNPIIPIVIEIPSRIPSMERLSEVYAEHIAELGDLLRGRCEAAETLAANEGYAERLRLSASFNVEGKNETERKASLASLLLDDSDYQGLLVAIKEDKQRMNSLDIAIELKRLRMRLAGWQMEWLIAQGPPDQLDRYGEVKATRLKKAKHAPQA